MRADAVDGVVGTLGNDTVAGELIARIGLLASGSSPESESLLSVTVNALEGFLVFAFCGEERNLVSIVE